MIAEQHFAGDLLLVQSQSKSAPYSYVIERGAAGIKTDIICARPRFGDIFFNVTVARVDCIRAKEGEIEFVGFVHLNCI